MQAIETIKRGTLHILILALLQREDLYGYQIWEEIKHRSKELFQV